MDVGPLQDSQLDSDFSWEICFSTNYIVILLGNSITYSQEFFWLIFPKGYLHPLCRNLTFLFHYYNSLQRWSCYVIHFHMAQWKIFRQKIHSNHQRYSWTCYNGICVSVLVPIVNMLIFRVWHKDAIILRLTWTFPHILLRNLLLDHDYHSG